MHALINFSVLNTNIRILCIKFIIRILCIKSNAQKMKFSIKDFFSKCDQVHRELQIWSNLRKILNEKFLFLYCGLNLVNLVPKLKLHQIYLKMCTLVILKVLNMHITIFYRKPIFGQIRM